MFGASQYLAVQSVRQKKQSSIKAPCWAKCFLVLEEERRSQASRLHLWFEVHMVLIQNPLRAGQDAKEVCGQLNGITSYSWGSEHTQNFSSNFQTSTQITESYIWHRFDLKLLTAFGFLHMLHCLPRVNACIMKIPAASTSFSKLHLLKSSWNL